MNKLEEQAKFVQDALRAGKNVAVAVPRQDLFERVVRNMVPEDLEIAARSNRLRFRFTNGAVLSFVPTTAPGHDVRGIRYDLAYYYLTHPEDMIPVSAREQERRVIWDQLATDAEMHELELP